MRKMLFRGFTPEENGSDKVYINGEWIKGQWVKGNYMSIDKTTYCFKEDYDKHPDNTEHYIIFDQMTDWGLPNRHLQADVIPETVGQYTGLPDKNGKKVFEGDIVRVLLSGKPQPVGVVKYAATGICGFVAITEPPYSNYILDKQENFEVIGNIYDKPEYGEEGSK